MRLCLAGHWRAVLVDDCIPCRSLDGGGQPAFSRSKGGELWPLLIEKAFAKAHGSYQAIANGMAGEALTTLTGADCVWVPADAPRCFEAVAAALHPSRDWFVVAVLPSGHGDAHLAGTGLVPGHAYSVLETLELPAVPGSGGAAVRLYKMRNPWGVEHYFGPYGRAPGSVRDAATGDYPLSAAWTPAVRAQMAARSQQLTFCDGCFWLGASELATCFAGVSICRDTPGTRHVSEEALLAPAGHTSALTLTVGGRATLAVDVGVRQADARRQAGTSSAAGFVYLGTRCYVVRADNLQIVASMPFTAQRDAWMEASLDPGRYWLLVDCDWDGAERPDSVAAAATGGGGRRVVPVGVVARAVAPEGDLTLLAPPDGALPPGGGADLLRAALAASAARASEADTLFFDSLFDHPAAVALQVSRLSKRRFACEGQYTVAWLYRNGSSRLALTETLPFSLRNVSVRTHLITAAGGQAAEPAEESAAAEPGERAGAAPADDGAAGEAARDLIITLTVAPGETRLLVLSQARAGAFCWELQASSERGARAELEEVPRQAGEA